MRKLLLTYLCCIAFWICQAQGGALFRQEKDGATAAVSNIKPLLTGYAQTRLPFKGCRWYAGEGLKYSNGARSLRIMTALRGYR